MDKHPEPTWHPNSRAMPIIWRLIEANPGCAVCDLIRWSGIRRQIIDKALDRLIAHKYIHISGYQRYESTRSGMARQFTVGEGENKPRPKVHRDDQRRAYTKRKKYYARVQRAKKKGQSAGNPFGIMLAQLELVNYAN